jgi:hypothetical protein
MKIIRPILLLFLKQIGSIFFDSRYLRGRYFDSGFMGWKWVLRSILWQKVFGFNRHIPWPISPFISISSAENISFDVNDLSNFQLFGCYFQNFSAQIVIGKGTYIAPNVGIITSNHNPNDLRTHLPGKDVIIGKNCWIGMNSIILPGVKLGDNTVVGAGSVVTKSFPQGSCVIAGNPAKIIKILNGNAK